MAEKRIGKITHYFDKIGVAIVELLGNLSLGDHIHVKGTNTDFEQEVNSMQVDHNNVSQAKKGEVVGLKVDQKVKEGDEIFSIT
ncbi:MAG: translation elongation factor-like protein [Candidatus Pacebacteria bacterium]|nr:translation elongation factor-like protein [Candidatus Paceibacterota bacterium]